MWKFCLLLVLVFSSSSCFAQNIVQDKTITREDKPRDSRLWDFGQVKQGEVLRHKFVLKNETKGTLNIKEINTSCACTASEVKKRTLSPGESTTIEVLFKTKGYSGMVQQFIYVHTDNLENPVIKFTVKAVVVK
jgi:hypothetical protein